MMSHSIIHSFKKCNGEGEVKVRLDDSTKLMVTLTIKVIGYLVVGLYHDLMGPPFVIIFAISSLASLFASIQSYRIKDACLSPKSNKVYQ